MARLGFILIGTFIGLSSIAGIGRTFGSMAANQTGPQPSLIISVLLATLVFGILPAAFIILRSSRLADRFFDRSSAHGLRDVPAVVTAVIAVLAVFLIIRGGANLVAALAVLAFLSGPQPFLAMPTRDAGAALVCFVAGIGLFIEAAPIGRAISSTQ